MFELNLLNLKRKLIITKTPGGINIAGFNPVGDMKLLQVCAKHLAKQIKEHGISCDFVLTTEFKGLPIAQEVARLLKKDYICLRKEAKCYMGEVTSLNSESITSGKSCYFISGLEKDKLQNKNVIFVDDVFSTGSTFEAIAKFSSILNFNLNACAVILKEDFLGWEKTHTSPFMFNSVPVFYCGFLPLQEDFK